MWLKSIFKEFRRRNIYKVAIAYGITAWVVVQVASIASNAFGAPAWVMKMIITLLLLGFPVVLIFAWAFEITPDGIKRTKSVAKSDSITNYTGRKLNYWIIGLLSTAVLFLLVERFWLGGSNTNSIDQQEETNIVSIAVLPFNDFSPDNDQEWFADGLTEELLNSLARLPDLKVAARTSSFQFKNKNLPIKTIAETLGVKNILEGSIRRAGDEMRITGQLIRAEDGFHLWSQTYDRKIDDVFTVQEDISENIASALDIYLDEQKRETMFAFGTRNVEAYEAYMKGRSIYEELHQSRIDTNLFTEANPWFEKAIHLDPEFAAPYYYHHDAYYHYILNYPNITIDTLSIEQAKNSMLSDLDQAIKHAAEPGHKLMYEFENTFLSDDWSRIPDLVSQLKSNPQAKGAYIMLNGGWARTFLNITGNAKLQYQLNKQALQSDPLHAGLKRSNIQALFSLGETDSALTVIDNFVSQTDNASTDTGVQMLLLIQNGQMEKAESLIQDSPNHPLYILMQAFKGNTEEAKERFENTSEVFKNHFNSSIVHYALGDIEKANNLAHQVDTTHLGGQKLAQRAAGMGGLIPYELSAAPNLSARFREAGVEVKPVQLGEVKIPKIVQRD